MNVINKLCTLSLIILLSGCGFQLRGSVELPEGVEPIYIGGLNNSGQLSIELRNLLKAHGVELSSDAAAANYQLIILEQQSDRRTASLGAGARVAEFQLIESVDFELRNKEGRSVLGPVNITERKIMPNDPNKVVSSSEEEKILRRDMLQQLAAKIARQLRAFDYQPHLTTEP
jgi:LPS-assembly lipoprotein